MLTILLYCSCAYYCYSFCSVADSDRVAEELQRADTVVLTYACDRPETLENLSTFWLPHLRNLEVMISPVIVFVS
jgi:mitochondrial Rho GTPase 1